MGLTHYPKLIQSKFIEQVPINLNLHTTNQQKKSILTLTLIKKAPTREKHSSDCQNYHETAISGSQESKTGHPVWEGGMMSSISLSITVTIANRTCL